MLTKDEKRRIKWIKDNLETRKKWTKQDYIDFYDRDIKLLISLVEKVHASQLGVETNAESRDKCIYFPGCIYIREFCNICKRTT